MWSFEGRRCLKSVQVVYQRKGLKLPEARNQDEFGGNLSRSKSWPAVGYSPLVFYKAASGGRAEKRFAETCSLHVQVHVIVHAYSHIPRRRYSIKKEE